MTKQKANEIINKINFRKKAIRDIMTNICMDILLGKDPKKVDYEDFTKVISKVHPYILKLFKTYKPIKQHHDSSIGNEHINCQVFLDDNGKIRRVIVRNYHCSHMITEIKNLIEE